MRMIPYASLAVLLLVAACGDSDEVAPLRDGLHLQYEFGFGVDAVLIDVKAKADGDDHFVLEIATEGGDEEDEEKGPATIRVDRSFRTGKGKLAQLLGPPLWIPPSMREPGEAVADDGSLSIRTKGKTWNGWNVVVAGGAAGLGMVEWYYHKDTGFLVGTHAESMGSAMGMKLVESNVAGLGP